MMFGKIIVIAGVLVIFILFGLFIYLLINYEKKRRANFLKNAIETEGMVEGVTFGFHFSYPSFFLKYTYYDQYKTKYKDDKAIGIQAFGYKKGEKIIVFYDKADPTSTIITLKQKEK